jgi:hypothetical protein
MLLKRRYLIRTAYARIDIARERVDTALDSIDEVAARRASLNSVDPCRCGGVMLTTSRGRFCSRFQRCALLRAEIVRRAQSIAMMPRVLDR